MKLENIRKKVIENNYDLDVLNEEEVVLLERFNKLKHHKGKIVRHFKNKYYMVIDIAEHTETKEDFVIYKAMYGDNKIYARPIDMFLSRVDKVKYPMVEEEYRMTFIDF